MSIHLAYPKLYFERKRDSLLSPAPPRQRLPAAFSDHRPLSIIRYHGFCVVADRPNQPTKPIPTLIDPTPRGEGGRTVRSRYRNTTSIKSNFFSPSSFYGKMPSLQGLMALCIIGKVDFVSPFGCVLLYLVANKEASLPPGANWWSKKFPFFFFPLPSLTSRCDGYRESYHRRERALPPALIIGLGRRGIAREGIGFGHLSNKRGEEEMDMIFFLSLGLPLCHCRRNLCFPRSFLNRK